MKFCALALDYDTAGGGDEDLVLLDALVGQLIAFFRCLGAGYRPDSPSEDSVITRVVSTTIVPSFSIQRTSFVVPPIEPDPSLS